METLENKAASIGRAVSGVVTKASLVEFCKTTKEWHDFKDRMRDVPPENVDVMHNSKDAMIIAKDDAKAFAKGNTKDITEARYKMPLKSRLSTADFALVVVRCDYAQGRFVVGSEDGYIVVGRYSVAAKRIYVTNEIPEMIRLPLAGAKGSICHDKSRYDKYVQKTGRTSMDCADPLALYLRESVTVEAIVKLAGSWLNSIKYPLPSTAFKQGWIDEDTANWPTYLRNRYSSLNNGQQRMIIGAILRKAIGTVALERDCDIEDVIETMPSY